MNKLIATSLIALGLMASTASATSVKLGVLTCNVDGGWGLLVGSTRIASCVFTDTAGEVTAYDGTVTRLGIDVGYVGAKTLAWAVMSTTDSGESTLAGSYVGANAEAALGVGAGVNVLVGGFEEAYALQPLSGQIQTGVSAALTVERLELQQ